jgi:hypothetical protein
LGRAVLIFILLALPNAVTAEAAFGGVFLASGNPRFPCSQALRFHRSVPGPAYHATLWGTFGYSKRCWRKVFRLHKPVTMEFYATSEPTRRRGAMTRLDFMPRLSVTQYDQRIRSGKNGIASAFIQRASDILQFCQEAKKKNDQCLFSPCLECSLTQKATRRLLAWAKEAGWRKSELVLNPNGGRFDSGALGAGIVESHNWLQSDFPTKTKRIITLDGWDSHLCGFGTVRPKISTAQVREWRRRNNNRVDYRGAWCPMWQGLTGRGQYLEPHRRNFSLSGGSLNSFVEIAREI